MHELHPISYDARKYKQAKEVVSEIEERRRRSKGESTGKLTLHIYTQTQHNAQAMRTQGTHARAARTPRRQQTLRYAASYHLLMTF